jgi:23S rRNA (cytidine1920-2'-O)/16S rRNA (cytidine1409-2'-O)-methyltransferase
LERNRLDVLLVNKGYFPTREKARSSIMAGIVFVNNERVDKPGMKFGEDINIEIKGNSNPYVSRGGLKLAKALESFNISPQGLIVIDVGASTGGFTDCLLKNGASRVYAIDVGYGQFAWELRNDERVVCMERTNIRYVKPEDIGTAAHLAVIDVSFISLKKVLPVVKDLITKNGEVICLIKPQFEAGRGKVGKHGVVREPSVHEEVLQDIVHFAVELGFRFKGITYSPIKGPEGNIEYLLYISKTGGLLEETELEREISRIVRKSHKYLN